MPCPGCDDAKGARLVSPAAQKSRIGASAQKEILLRAVRSWSSAYDSFSFLYVGDPVDGNRHRFDSAARPPDIDAINFAGFSQAEMQTTAALPRVTVSAINLTDLDKPGGLQPDASANRVAIGFGANEL